MLSQVLLHPLIQLGTHRGRTHRGLRTRLDIPREDSLDRSTLAHVAVSHPDSWCKAPQDEQLADLPSALCRLAGTEAYVAGALTGLLVMCC